MHPLIDHCEILVCIHATQRSCSWWGNDKIYQPFLHRTIHAIEAHQTRHKGMCTRRQQQCTSCQGVDKRLEGEVLPCIFLITFPLGDLEMGSMLAEWPGRTRVPPQLWRILHFLIGACMWGSTSRYTYTYAHACDMFSHVHKYIHNSIHANTCTCMYTTYIHMAHACTWHLHTYIHPNTCTYTYTCMYTTNIHIHM